MKVGWSSVSRLQDLVPMGADVVLGALDSGGKLWLGFENDTLTYPLNVAHGIIVPLLKTADDAKKLVQSAKFPPAGDRGVSIPADYPVDIQRFHETCETCRSREFPLHIFLSLPIHYISQPATS